VSAREQRRAIFESWETMAPGWERWRERIDETTAPVREWLIEALEPLPGETVLELAAGPGDTGFAAAEALRGTGRVISTDLVPAMVEIAQRRSAELGLTNVEHRVMDAERIELEDGAVDGVVCKFGYMLMPDQRAACAETRRVLRPEGRLALAVWRSSELNPWISVAGRLLVERGLVPPPERGAPGIFALANEERLRALLEGSGFRVDRTEDVVVSFVYADLDDYVSRARETGGVFARVWSAASEEERAAIRGGLEAAFAPYENGGRYEVPGVALCALAR
jgi:ubiquinone/menaquinone biosynthesis C-methylase UbiE